MMCLIRREARGWYAKEWLLLALEFRGHRALILSCRLCGLVEGDAPVVSRCLPNMVEGVLRSL